MLDGQGLENRQPEISHLLVFHRAAYQHIVVAVRPIRRQALLQAVNPFGEEIEIKVLTLTHHLPALPSPLVGILQKEVGSKTGEYKLAARDFVGLVPLEAHRQIECRGLAADAACHGAAIHLILTINVAVLAARTDLGTPVPGIPVGVYVPAFSHPLLS